MKLLDDLMLSAQISSPSLVGRERELALLRDRLLSALAGHGGLVFISGAAGVGKTTLAEAVCRAAVGQGALSLIGRCYDLTETPPYGPWIEIFAHYRPDNDDWPARPAAFAQRGTIGTVASQAALFHEVRELFAAVSARTPVVLLLDDLHWSDPASLDLLRFLARSLATLPLLILATYRDETPMEHHVLMHLLPRLVREVAPTRLTLNPLNADAVRALVQIRYGATIVGVERLHVYLQTVGEGNPFFIGELLHALENDGRLRRSADGPVVGDLTHAGVPPVLRQVIAERVGRLGPEVTRLLGIAAVIGHEVPLDLWMAVAAVDEATLFETLERAVAGHVLAEMADGTRARFVHTLLREVLYEGMLVARRRVWHRAIAEALLSQPDADSFVVADHLRHAGDVRAAHWLIRAGDHANRAFAYQTAIARFTDALAMTGDDAAQAITRCELLIRLARLLRITDTAQAIQYEEEAVQLAIQAQDEVLAAVARFRLGYLLSYVGQRKRGLAFQLEGLAALDALPPSAMARVAPLEFICADFTSRHGSVAQRLVHVGRLRDAESHADHALAAVDGVLNRYSEDAWMALAIVDRLMGRPEEGWRRCSDIASIYRNRGEHDIATWLVGSPLIWMALVFGADNRLRLQEMRTLLEARLPQNGELFATLPLALLHLPVLYIEGAWAEARQIIEEVRRSPFGHHGYAYGAWLVHLLIAVAQGDTDTAWSLVREEFPSGAATEPGNNHYDTAVFYQQIAATLTLDAGDLAGARAWLEAHDRWLAWSDAVLGRAENHLLWARYHRARNEATEAYDRATRALQCATAPRQPLALLAAHRLLGELDGTAKRHEGATMHLEAALALADACGAPYERALTLLALANLRGTVGEYQPTLALLDEVRAVLIPLGARPASDRAEALAARVTAAAARNVRHSPGGLTAREVEVLRALAAGMSNRQIADALTLSIRTVERHINNVYVKIDAHGRVEASAYARRHDLL